MAGVDPFVAEVPGDLEDPLVAPDDEPLQIELRGDAQAEVDVERVGMGEERAGQRPTGLRLQDRRVDLHEPVGGQQGTHGGDGLEPDVEDPAAVRVGQEVDLTLAVAGVRRGQAVPLVGQRAQGLGQQVQFDHVHGQLTPTAGDHLALGTDPVAQVQLAEHRGGRGRQHRGLHQQLNGAGYVLQRGEGELSVATQ